MTCHRGLRVEMAFVIFLLLAFQALTLACIDPLLLGPLLLDASVLHDHVLQLHAKSDGHRQPPSRSTHRCVGGNRRRVHGYECMFMFFFVFVCSFGHSVCRKNISWILEGAGGVFNKAHR